MNPSFSKIDQYINDSLAKRIDKYWEEHSIFKARKAGYGKYTIPKNCETLVTPYNRRVDTESVEIQNVLVKTTALVAQLADSVLLADKESGMVTIMCMIYEAICLAF